MKKILILEDRKDAVEKIERWLSVNYPEGKNCAIIKVSDLSKISSSAVGEYDVVVFTGTVGGKHLIDHFEIIDSWKNRLFVFHDDTPSTRYMLIKLRKARIQTLRLAGK